MHVRRDNIDENLLLNREYLTPGLYKMAGTAERESNGPETPPCEADSGSP